ncbi:MAG TPA: OmpH family outer membrane protein [Puia sp.]|jgi:outer membrane protein|nr:OmpH family outer membrane protein [Puia sp.]
MKTIIATLLLVNIGLASFGQIAFVDSKYILNKMPDYRDSLAKINQTAKIWQKEIEDKQAIVEKMTLDFNRDEVMLTDDAKKNRTDALNQHQKEVRELQRARFGFEGELFKMRQALLKPMEDSVMNAIQKTANRLSYATVLDKSEGITVIYTNPRLDITNEVMKDMGIL